MTPNELTEVLDRLIAGCENEVVEFKTSSNQFSADKTGEYVSAMANEANGLAARSMAFGTDNDRNVVGIARLRASRSRQPLKHHEQQSSDKGRTLGETYKLPNVPIGDQKQGKGPNLLTCLRRQGAIESAGRLAPIAGNYFEPKERLNRC